MFDLRPAAGEVARLVTGVGDEDLGRVTPCENTTVGDLLDHVDGLCVAFARAAAKATPPGDGPPPAPDGRMPGPDWRTRIPERPAGLAQAWQAGSAWTGMTRVGGVDLPGEVTALVALDELVVHGWDLAVSTGQGYDVDPDLLAATHEFVHAAVAEHPQGNPGMFGPPVPAANGGSVLTRVIASTGRDPAWQAPAR